MTDKLTVNMPTIRRVAVRVTARDRLTSPGWSAIEHREERYEERFEPANGDFYDVYRTVEGEPVSPENSLDVVLAGGVIVTNFEEASLIVHRLSTEARLGAETARYQRVLDAFVYVECRRRESAAWRLVGFDPEHEDLLLPDADRSLFTVKELAEIYGVSEAEIRARAGRSLPAAIKSKDGKLVFKASAILTQLRNAGPARCPERPVSPKPTVPSPQDPTAPNPKRREKAAAK